MDSTTNCPYAVSCITNKVITGRLIFKGGVPNTPTDAVIPKWKDDFLLASLYQDSWMSGTRGTQKCDKTHVLVSDYDSYIFTSANMTKAHKCSYIVSVVSDYLSPAIELITLGNWAPLWQFQWAEWFKDAMATGGFLPVSSTDPLYLGDYPAHTPYPNPISEGSFSGFTPNALKFFEEKDPSSHSPGDIDELIYYPYKEGAFRDTATAKVPFHVLKDSYLAQQAIIDDYL